MNVMGKAKPISCGNLNQFSNDYSNCCHKKAMKNALSKANIADVTFVSENARKMQPKFSIDIETMPATNQKSSGRCWLFAGLNVLREIIAKKYNIESFELSQNYIAFWDKFEKINYMLESIIDTANLNSDDRTVSWILSTGIQDGGQWDMFVSLIKKYGIVPKDAMPETFASSNTGAMNAVINTKTRGSAALLRSMINSGASVDAVTAKKEEILNELYSFLCMCFSTPPTSFDFEYVNKDKEYNIIKNVTPMDFYNEYMGGILDDYVSIIHAPTKDKPFNKAYTVKYLGNVVGGNEIVYINLKLSEFKDLILKQLTDKEVVWFGSDVGKFGDRETGVWDDASYDYKSAFSMEVSITKEDSLDYRDSCMNHAMVITGVNIDDGKPNRWKIQNSWGDDKGKKGYFMSSDSWFDKQVYQGVVHKKYLTPKMQEILAGEKIYLNPWDPMGSLAN